MNGVTLFVALIAFGVVTGIASGLLGVGGGTLMVPFLTLAAGLSQHAAEAKVPNVILWLMSPSPRDASGGTILGLCTADPRGLGPELSPVGRGCGAGALG